MDGSVVEYVSTFETPTKCGYCKRYDTSYTQGVWGYKMACHDFQALVDRGFQRSGNYVYRPVMRKTCCPQYVIRMDVREFKISKSQKSCIKKFKRYLVEGLPEKEKEKDPLDSSSTEGASCQQGSTSGEAQPLSSKVKGKPRKEVRPGAGPDPNKPLCKKAKILRQERRAKKQLIGSQKEAASSSSKDNQPTLAREEPQDSELSQELKELLTFTNEEGNVHTFKTRLLPAKHSDPDFASTSDESYEVFHKFQTGIHNEAEEDAQLKQFKNFLLDSPLAIEKHSDNISFGTFHYHYLIDDKIFAVGVLDILPKGVVCEYLYYNPYFRFIAPGVITALLEISLAQQYYLQDNTMMYYYMGFYVQSCPKMNYKSQYSASALLCTETYTYVDLEKCIPVLKATPYARLADPEVEDANDTCTEDELAEVVLLTHGAGIIKYGVYKRLTGIEVDDVIRGYVSLVGKEMATTMKAHIAATEKNLQDEASP